MKPKLWDSLLTQILQDPLLKDIPLNFKPKDIQLQIWLEQGKAISVEVARSPLPSIDVIVTPKCRLSDLKQRFEKAWMNSELRAKKHVNWTYIWKHYCFSFGKTKLLDDKALLKDIGIHSNGCRLNFARIIPSRR